MSKTFWASFSILCLLSTVFLAGLAFNIQIVKAETNCDFFGVGEPLTYRSIGPTHENLNVSKAFEVMEDLGVRRLREWVWRWMVFYKNATGLNQTIVNALNDVVMKAESLSITVMGMVQDFPAWMTGIGGDQQAVPYRNLTEGSNYTKFLDRYEESWETLARTFPNITVWEIGNEYNLPQFLHPPGYNETDSRTWFCCQEQVDIVTDLLYYGSKGINASNPNATRVMCGLGPGENGIDGIKNFLESIYENIESDKWPSKNSNDFFQVACWHPYLFTEKPNWYNWVEPNIKVYNVMVNHGDGDKPVVFSEFGYSDVCTGLNEIQVAEYLNKTFTFARDLRPWLKSIYWFRLIDPDPCCETWYARMSAWSEYGFGLVKRPAENYVCKPVAHAYKKSIHERMLVHDVAVASVTPSTNEILKGQTMNISVVVQNNGNFTETLNVTLFANTNIIQTQTVSELAPPAQTVLTFIWNTTEVPLGNYTIKAEACIVQGETHATDNINVNGAVNVIPEFPLPVILLLTVMLLLAIVFTTLAVIIGKKRLTKNIITQ